MFRLHGLPLALRPKEHAVLEALVLRAGKVVGKESLFEKAFSLDATTNPEAVEIYVCRLRKKLEGSGVSIVTVRGLGYVLETAPSRSLLRQLLAWLLVPLDRTPCSQRGPRVPLGAGDRERSV